MPAGFSGSKYTLVSPSTSGIGHLLEKLSANRMPWFLAKYWGMFLQLEANTPKPASVDLKMQFNKLPRRRAAGY
jgi:hypothetical protein